MNSFLRRLKYYGIGFGLGVVVVMFILPNRSCSWTPSNRVKNMILSRFITVNDIEWKLMQNKGLSSEDIVSALNDGTIDFRASKTKGDFKVYVIDKKITNKGLFRFYFTLPDESFISEVKFAETDTQEIENTQFGYGRFLSFPNDDYLIYPDSTEKIRCQMQQLNLTDVKEIYSDIKKTGRLNFENTHFTDNLKSTHQIDYVYKNDTVSMKAIWYKNKVFVSDFISKKIVECP